MMLPWFRNKTSAAGLSIVSNSALVIGKIVIGLTMGSVSVLAEGIHSGVDLLAALLAFFSIRAAVKPPDAQHRFGHGKIENISGTVEGLLIFGAAGFIIYEAVQRIMDGVEVDQLGLGIVVMGVSTLANFIVSRHLHAVAKKTESIALEADAWHLTTDVYTSLGVFGGLVLVWFTGWLGWEYATLLDPIVAIGVAGLIVKAAWDITHKALKGLLDTSLPQEELALIRESVKSGDAVVLGFHGLATRQSGSERFIKLHVVFPRAMHLDSVHVVCDRVEALIKEQLPNSHITIHSEPCTVLYRDACAPVCPSSNVCPDHGRQGSGSGEGKQVQGNE
jgi:cation diffusion facilitator family transporter